MNTRLCCEFLCHTKNVSTSACFYKCMFPQVLFLVQRYLPRHFSVSFSYQPFLVLRYFAMKLVFMVSITLRDAARIFAPLLLSIARQFISAPQYSQFTLRCRVYGLLVSMSTREVSKVKEVNVYTTPLPAKSLTTSFFTLVCVYYVSRLQNKNTSYEYTHFTGEIWDVMTGSTLCISAKYTVVLTFELFLWHAIDPSCATFNNCICIRKYLQC